MSCFFRALFAPFLLLNIQNGAALSSIQSSLPVQKYISCLNMWRTGESKEIPRRSSRCTLCNHNASSLNLLGTSVSCHPSLSVSLPTPSVTLCCCQTVQRRQTASKNKTLKRRRVRAKSVLGTSRTNVRLKVIILQPRKVCPFVKLKNTNVALRKIPEQFDSILLDK